MADVIMSNVSNMPMSTKASKYYTSETHLRAAELHKIGLSIWYYGFPIILLFGNFGNIMTIIIMRRMKSGEAVINIYFIALAIVDMVSLDIFLLHEWIGWTFGIVLSTKSNALCKIYNWVTTASTTIGGWYLVGMTIHRAVSVVWPHRVNLLCTRRLVIGVIVGMTAFFAVLYSHYLYGYNQLSFNNTNTYYCRMKTGAYLQFVHDVFTYVDLVLYSLLPFTCITIANGVLVWKLRASVRDIRKKFEDRGSEQITAREKAARSVTWTVVLVSGAYILLTLPAAFYHVSTFISMNYTNSMSVLDHAIAYLISDVCYMLMFSNSAVNFYIYCLTGERFRREFMKLFCPRRFKDVSVRTVQGPSQVPTRPL